MLVLNFFPYFRHKYRHSKGHNNEFIRLVLHIVTNSKDSHKVQLSRIMRYYVGSCGHKLVRGPNMSFFHLSCVRLLYFLRKSTEFHFKRIERQIIIIHFLLIIFSSFLQSLRFRPLPPTSV